MSKAPFGEVTPARRQLAERLAKHLSAQNVSLSDPVEWMLNGNSVGAMMFHFLADEIDSARAQAALPPAEPAKGSQAQLF